MLNFICFILNLLQILNLGNNPVNIQQVVLQNYKSFKERTTVAFNDGLNILVGDNEAGKSTILEAIHLCLSGILDGKYLKHDFHQYLFNYEVVD